MDRLDGISMLEVADDVAGAFCGSVFAQLGADVMKVERPRVGDPLRHSRRGLALFAHLNAGKRSLTLDEHSVAGQDLLAKAVRSVDLVLRSSNAPSFYQDSHAILMAGGKPLCCMTPFGETGPHATFCATPLVVDHASGEGNMLPGGREYVGSRPARAARQASEYDAGFHAAFALLAALLDANAQPPHIDISKQEATATAAATTATNFLNDGMMPSRNSTAIGVGGCLPCKDGYVQVFVPDDSAWRALVRMLGDPPWAPEERFSTAQKREANKDELNLLLTLAVTDYTKAEIVGRALEAGCPVGAYRTPEDLLQSEQLAARSVFRAVDAPGIGELLSPRVPWEHSDETDVADSRTWVVPALGSGNRQVYGRLGLREAELLELEELGVT